MNDTNYDVIIAGAGLTGLSLAFWLGRRGKKVLVVEKDEAPGGVIRTVRDNGFIYETGPNTGVLSTPAIVRLFSDLGEHNILETASKTASKRYVMKNGMWHALPSGLKTAVTTPLFTMKDKFRILGEPFRRRGTNPDEVLSDLVIRRMGRSFLDYAVDPFISGIYAGDPSSIVPRYALPKLYALEQNYGSFIRGTIKKARLPKTEDQKLTTGEVFSARGGLGSLVDALVAGVGEENILTGIRDLTFLPENNMYEAIYTAVDGREISIKAKNVVTTFGGLGLKKVLPFISARELAPVLTTKYAPVVQVAVGYKTWTGRPIDAFGGLVPTLEKRNILGILFPSAMFEGRCPAGGAMMSVFMGGVKKPFMIEKSDDEIRSIVLEELKFSMNTDLHPDLLKIFRYTHAIPQYDASTGERLEAIWKMEQKHPGLILAGNIRDGIGMADRAKQAFQLAGLLTR